MFSLLPTDSLVDFSALMTIHHPFHGAIPFVAHEYQRDLMHEYELTFRGRLALAVNYARQMGLSHLSVSAALWAAACNPNTHVISIHHRQTSATDFMSRVHYNHDFMDERFRPKATQKTQQRLTLANGSTINATSYSSAFMQSLGKRCDLVLMEDVAFAMPRETEHLHDLTADFRARGTSMIIYSTPNKASGYFHDVWNEGRHNFNKASLRWDAHPDRDARWAAAYRSQLGAVRFAQEFENQFA